MVFQATGPRAFFGASTGQPARRAGWRKRCMAVAVAVSGFAAAAQTATMTGPSDVQPGDTFSSIASRYTGDVRNWRSLYNAELSGLSNPNLILVGMRFELATDATGKRYLHLVGAPGARAAVAAAPAPVAAAPAPVAAPALAPRAVPKPAALVAAVAPSAPVLAAPAAPVAAPVVVVPPLPAAADAPLVIGVLPNIAASALIPQYDMLRRYLERVGGHKVRVVVPANFKAFFDSAMGGEFDIAVSAPHLARVLQLERNLVPLVIYEPRINALLIAPADSAFAGPRDLRERAVAYANPQSLVAMYGQQWLRQQNLEAGKDFEVKSARTDLGVGRMLLSGDVAAAIMSNGEFRALPPEESSRLKVVEVFARIPNFVVLAHPRLEQARIAKLRSQFKAFLADTEDGLPFAKATGFSGMIDADDVLLRELDPYVAQTRRAMGVVK